MELKAGYILLSLVMTVVTVALAFGAVNMSVINPSSRKRKKIYILLGFVLWNIYVYLIAKSGIIVSFELPPRFPIFLIFPLFLFTGLFLYKNKNKRWIDYFTPQKLVYFQSFRIVVEVLFVYSVAQNILHPNVTIEGYNYDMMFGFSALALGLLVYVFKVVPEKFVKYWNYLGLIVLISVIFVFTTTVFFPGFYGYDDYVMPYAFFEYPYIIVAGFLMPLAVFMHCLSLIHINKNWKK